MNVNCVERCFGSSWTISTRQCKIWESHNAINLLMTFCSLAEPTAWNAITAFGEV